MNDRRRALRYAGAVGACAVVGAGAAVAGNAASAPSPSSAAGATQPAAHGWGGHHRGRFGGLRGAVHADLVVPTTGGGFAKATLDRGTVKAVSANSITLDEGTAKATYRTVTLTVPAGARVRVDRQPATLASVKAGQRAIVVQGPRGTRVLAHDKRQR